MTPERRWIFSGLLLLLLFSSCSKDVQKHGIKGKIVVQTSNQPLMGKMVMIDYSATSLQRGNVSVSGNMASGYTDITGSFTFYFNPDEDQLNNGEFIISADRNNIMERIDSVSAGELKEKSVVDLGVIVIN